MDIEGPVAPGCGTGAPSKLSFRPGYTEAMEDIEALEVMASVAPGCVLPLLPLGVTLVPLQNFPQTLRLKNLRLKNENGLGLLRQVKLQA